MTPSVPDHTVVNTVTTTHTLSDFDFALPEALIALHANDWPVLALFEGPAYREGLSRIQ